MGTYVGMGPKELLEKDVVLVEIQYRLGPLGFMCLDHDEAAGNMGMLDQVREGSSVGHREYLRGKYHCTVDLLLDWFGLVCFANKNKNC